MIHLPPKKSLVYLFDHLRKETGSSLSEAAAKRCPEGGIQLQDIDLEAGTIHTRAMIKTMARTLKLKFNQMMLFYDFIHKNTSTFENRYQTTEKYRQSGLEELQTAIDKHYLLMRYKVGSNH